MRWFCFSFCTTFRGVGIFQAIEMVFVVIAVMIRCFLFLILIICCCCCRCCCHGSVIENNNSAAAKAVLASYYAQARRIRSLLGHDAAQPYYQDLLLKFNPNDRTAATRIAAESKQQYQHNSQRIVSHQMNLQQRRRRFIELLQTQIQYTPDSIANALFSEQQESNNKNHKQWNKMAKSSSAPLYIKPLQAGSKVPPLPTCAITTCIQLFLMAVCVPMDICYQYLGTEFVSLMISLGIIITTTTTTNGNGGGNDNENDLAIPYCHIMPVNIQQQQHQMLKDQMTTTTTTTKTLYVATDLHPNVLATCTIGKNDNDQAVMYIGPDSLALVDHYYYNLNDASSSSTFREEEREEKIVDIGSGSGIQALHLAAARLSSSLPCCCCHVTSIDINPRALEFTRLNFEWNGLNPPKLILGDITKPYKKNGHLYDKNDDAKEMPLSWEDILQNATTIVANPPFLPVPTIHDDWNISKQQHGYFSCGGASGDVILRRIIELASQTLLSSKGDGTLAIVSEFMNPQTEFPSKFQSWWKSSSSSSSNDSKTSSSSSRGGSSSDGGGGAAAGGGGGCAVLFTNAEPLDAKTYASRRGASSVEEEQQWMLHLQQEKITEISPGLLFVQTNEMKKNKMQFHHHLVPKTELGSLWTPTNWKAREITRDVLKSYYWR